MSRYNTLLVGRKRKKFNIRKWWLKYWQLVAMVSLPFCFVALFSYGPIGIGYDYADIVLRIYATYR